VLLEDEIEAAGDRVSIAEQGEEWLPPPSQLRPRGAARGHSLVARVDGDKAREHAGASL
jgi:hypothetical protein